MEFGFGGSFLQFVHLHKSVEACEYIKQTPETCVEQFNFTPVWRITYRGQIYETTPATRLNAPHGPIAE